MLPFVVLLSVGCSSGDGSCTVGAEEEAYCYELVDGDGESVDNLQGGCKGTFSEDNCDTSGALFRCGDTEFSFFTQEAGGAVRTHRYDYYFWNPEVNVGQQCEFSGGTWETL